MIPVRDCFCTCYIQIHKKQPLVGKRVRELEAETSTFYNEENMKVIRNIFKENFEKQIKNIGNLISAKFKITIEEIKKSQNEIKNMGKEICDLRSRLKFPENVLEEKVKKLEERCYEWVSEFLSLSHTKKKKLLSSI